MQPHDWYVIWILGGCCGFIPLHDPSRRTWKRVVTYMAAFVLLLGGYAAMRRM